MELQLQQGLINLQTSGAGNVIFRTINTPKVELLRKTNVQFTSWLCLMALFLERHFLLFPKMNKVSWCPGYGWGSPGHASRHMSVLGSAGRSCRSHVEQFAAPASAAIFKAAPMTRWWLNYYSRPMWCCPLISTLAASTDCFGQTASFKCGSLLLASFDWF